MNLESRKCPPPPSLTESGGSQPSVKATVLIVPHHAAVIHQGYLLPEPKHVSIFLLRLRVHDLEASLVKNLDARSMKKKKKKKHGGKQFKRQPDEGSETYCNIYAWCGLRSSYVTEHSAVDRKIKRRTTRRVPSRDDQRHDIFIKTATIVVTITAIIPP